MQKTSVSAKLNARHFRNQFKRGGSHEVRLGPNYRIDATMYRVENKGPVIFLSLDAIRDQNRLAIVVGASVSKQPTVQKKREAINLARSLRIGSEGSRLP